MDCLNPKLKVRLDSLALRMDAAGFARRVLRFDANAQQEVVLRANAKRLLLCCSRQWGRSTTAAALVARLVVTTPKALVLVVGPTLRQSSELMLKVYGYLRQAGAAFWGGGWDDARVWVAGGGDSGE